jgi:glucose/arabinose dehydrogenase
LHQLATGLSSPLYVADAGDAPDRLYVVEQGGRILVLENGAVQTEPFLDIADGISTGWQLGLLSVAFPADYPQSGRFFVDYTDRDRNMLIERFERSADGNSADPSGGSVLMSVDLPFDDRDGGLLLFGPDGYLYVGVGSSGSGDPMDNGQRGDTLLGKLLRIDVSAGPGYSVPPDNPFVGDEDVRDEIWALGLGNPWRFSFDRETGDLWIGDVGGQRWEEIDHQPASSQGGENYGWARMEGPDCNDGPCDPSRFVAPVAAYDHGKGDCAVIGGYVYRGSAIPDLQGTYLYGDNCTGRIWGLHATDASSGAARSELLLESGLGISSFGEGRDGELYVTELSGGVYQIVASS